MAALLQQEQVVVRCAMCADQDNVWSPGHVECCGQAICKAHFGLLMCRDGCCNSCEEPLEFDDFSETGSEHHDENVHNENVVNDDFPMEKEPEGEPDETVVTTQEDTAFSDGFRSDDSSGFSCSICLNEYEIGHTTCCGQPLCLDCWRGVHMNEGRCRYCGDADCEWECADEDSTSIGPDSSSVSASGLSDSDFLVRHFDFDEDQNTAIVCLVCQEDTVWTAGRTTCCDRACCLDCWQSLDITLHHCRWCNRVQAWGFREVEHPSV